MDVHRLQLAEDRSLDGAARVSSHLPRQQEEVSWRRPQRGGLGRRERQALVDPYRKGRRPGIGTSPHFNAHRQVPMLFVARMLKPPVGRS